MQIPKALVQSLYQPIMDILEERPLGITEYELLKELEDRLFQHTGNKPFETMLNLFQNHFLIFHILYCMQAVLMEEKRGYLSIHCLNIALYPIQSKESNELGGYDPLKDYYLDPKNLEGVTESEVFEMVQKTNVLLSLYHQKQSAYKQLGLHQDCTDFQTIKRRYWSLVKENHPDHGGNAERFQQIQDAMEVLTQLFEYTPPKD